MGAQIYRRSRGGRGGGLDMRRFIKAMIPMAVTAAVTHFLLFLILGDILFTVAYTPWESKSNHFN